MGLDTVGKEYLLVGRGQCCSAIQGQRSLIRPIVREYEHLRELPSRRRGLSPISVSALLYTMVHSKTTNSELCRGKISCFCSRAIISPRILFGIMTCLATEYSTQILRRNTEIEIIWPLFSVCHFTFRLSKAAVVERPFIRISAGKKNLLADFLVENALQSQSATLSVLR